MTGPTTPGEEDDLVPVSVRLGDVVPPDDPEDWTQPLTWVAALGMLAGPIAVLAWFALGPPSQATSAVPLTFAAAGMLTGGAVATGATQQGIARASTATLGAGLFGALVIVIAGAVMAGERQVGAASPTLAHAFAAAVGGAGGSAAGGLVAAVVATALPRWARFAVALVPGVIVALVVVEALMPAA